MDLDREFFISALNRLPQNISIIDQTGKIRWTNHSWISFSIENGGCAKATYLNPNYLAACKQAGSRGDKYADLAYLGILSVIEGNKDSFQFEYPCHSPSESRWFLMNVCPLDWESEPHFIISHTNITDRKLAEMRAEERATKDSLTNIANRRTFDQFLELEWQMSRRSKEPMSVILLDVDQFKLFNDNYGHVAGDDCLKSIGKLLEGFEQRRGDLVARYGGEEFAVILGETDECHAQQIAENIRKAVSDLRIRHEFSCCSSNVTVSAGVATCQPFYMPHDAWHKLVAEADHYLYQSKANGRNLISFSTAESQTQHQPSHNNVA